MFDYLVIVPTCGANNALPRSFSRMVHLAEDNTLFVFSFNAVDKEEATKTLQFCQASALSVDQIGKTNVKFEFLWSDTPLGFAGAINVGFKHAVQMLEEIPETVIVLSDDCFVTQDWQAKLRDGLNAKHAYTEAYVKNTDVCMPFDVEGQVGMVGPVSDGVYNYGQCIATGDKNIDQVSQELMQIPNRQQPILSTFLVGFCFALSKDILPVLFAAYGENNILDNENYGIGGYEDNDICKTIVDSGFRILTIHNCFVGHIPHSTLGKYFTEQKSGMVNRYTYYKKYIDETSREKKIVAAYRVAIKTLYDLQVFASSLLASSILLDGATVLFTNDPSESLESYDKANFPSLLESEQAFIIACQEAKKHEVPEAHIENAFEEFVTTLDLQENFEVTVKVKLTGVFNERDERNETHAMAESMGADFIFSIDSDEIFEDRISKLHIQKCVNHPNPDVMHHRVGWINHWETMKLVRNDRPFSNGYKSGQYGSRLWKVIKKNPQRIHAGSPIGLHCGNCPEYGQRSANATAIRFRHLSHVRDVDRLAKVKFYNELDKQKDKLLLGHTTNYNHINRSEAVPVSIYNPKNGLLFSMLAYENESPELITQWWDRMYTISDIMTCIWTGEWHESDQVWVGLEREELEKLKDNWFETGPSYQLAWFSKVFQVCWIHEPLTEEGGLAHCRNAGIELGLDLIQQGAPISWHLFMDPDEMVDNWFTTSLVRCLEANDVHGFKFDFKNNLADGSFVHSDSIRLTRLVPGLFMTGRVHETFEHSLNDLRKLGHHIIIPDFPAKCTNNGLAGDEEVMAKKLEKYTKLLVQEIEKNPYDSRAWLSLGLQYANDGNKENALICYERACLTSGDAFMPWREAGIQYMREAKQYLTVAFQKMDSGHKMHPHLKAICEFLHKNIPDTQVVKTGAKSISDFVQLPDFPDDKVMVGQDGKVTLMELDDGTENTQGAVQDTGEQATPEEV